MFDDLTLPIKFDIVDNDIKFANMFMYDCVIEWFFAIDDFYSEHFNTLDALTFSAEPQKIVFNNNLISDKF